MEGILYKGPADVLLESINRVASKNGSKEAIGNQQIELKAVVVMASLDNEDGGNIVDLIRTSCVALRHDLNGARSSTSVVDRWIGCVDGILAGLNASSLAMPISKYIGRYISPYTARIEDISAYFDEPKYSLGRRIGIETLNEIVDALDLALSKLSVPDSVRSYIRGEIECIRDIIGRIEKDGIKDLWERFYFASEAVESSANYQEQRVKDEVSSLSRIWTAPIRAVVISGSIIVTGAGLIASATQVHQYLESDAGKPVKDFIGDNMRQLALPAPAPDTGD